MKLAKTLTYGLAAGMFASAVAFTAQAEVVAYSTLQITNFTITAGGEQIDIGAGVNVNNATSSRASFDGGAGDAASNATDTRMACVGACGGIAENDFSRISAGDSSLHFARGDALLTGSLLLPGGANAYSVAETQLTKNAGSNAGGEVSTSSFFWTIEFDGALGDITLEFDALGELLVASDIVKGSAQADFDWTLTLRDVTGGGNGTFVTEFSPDNLNESVAINGVDSASYSVDDHFIINVSGLLADRRYRLILSHNSDVEAYFEAPEPASMAALGLGLLALGGMAARRRKAA
jgi:hypothetical protein